MNGFFDVKILDAPPARVRESELLDLLTPAGKATPELDRLLANLPLAQRAGGRNLVLDSFPAYVLDHLFSGPTGPEPIWRNGAAAYLGTIQLETTDPEPTYQEFQSDGYVGPGGRTGSVTSDAWKRFVEDDVEAHNIVVDPTGREAIRFRSRFMFSQSQAVSSNIRSLACWYASNADSTTSCYRARGCRIRLKDSGGTPIVVSKTSSQILVLEYTFVLVTI